MDSSEFRKHAHTLVDWMADYMDNVGDLPVRSQVKPGDVAAQLTAKPPARGEDMTAIFDDFKSIVVPGMTHWQHPSFFAFFPANVSPPSVLAEMLIATMGAQCMMWETSPAATEMETRVMSWLGGMIGLPDNFSGVIQDTASTATFCAILAAREKATDWRVNDDGLAGAEQLTFYASVENHSSIEKAIKMAGIGKNNLRLIPSDDNFAMNVDALKAAIADDRAKGFTPAGIVACIGGTALGGIDDLTAVGAVAEAEGLYLHVDAAWAGSALICPENQHLIKGIEKADSFVFNPHKWMFTNFDCTAHFVKDTDTLVRTLTILPEYLKTREGSAVIDYRDWGVQLGRRFRALKLWFVIRSYGVEGLQSTIRNHISWAEDLAKIIDHDDGFELVTGPILSLMSFRYAPKGVDEALLDDMNERLLQMINDDGRTYLTRSRVNGAFVIRFQVGQTNTTKAHVMAAWDVVKEISRTL